MALGRKSGAMSQKGSPKAVYCLVSSAGVPTGPWVQMPFIKEATYKDNTEVEKVEDAGRNKYALDSAREASLELSFMQKDLDTANLMVKTLRGQYVAIVKEMHETTLDGKSMYRVLPLCKPVASIEETDTSLELKATFEVEPNSAAIGVDLSSTNTAGAWAVNIACNLFTVTALQYTDIFTQ